MQAGLVVDGARVLRSERKPPINGVKGFVPFQSSRGQVARLGVGLADQIALGDLDKMVLQKLTRKGKDESQRLGGVVLNQPKKSHDSDGVVVEDQVGWEL